MIAIPNAFNPDLGPTELLQASAQLADSQPEASEEFEDFASDLATIRNLPQFAGAPS